MAKFNMYHWKQIVKFVYYGIHDCITKSIVYPYNFHTISIVWKLHFAWKLHHVNRGGSRDS
jgi:hypothetical protein